MHDVRMQLLDVFRWVCPGVFQLRKIYGSKRPGYRLLIVDELQWLRYRSITSSSLTPTQQ